MKKLMIAVAIVCAAVVSQAATITWGTGSDYRYLDPSSKNPVILDATVGSMVLCVLGTEADYSDVIEIATAKFSTKAASVGQTTTKNTTFSFADGQYGIGENSILALLFKDTDNKYAQFVDVSGNAIAMELKVTGIAGETGKGDLWEGTLTASQNFTIASVPEPTSGLLLLLGVAGLALRRRRA